MRNFTDFCMVVDKFVGAVYLPSLPLALVCWRASFWERYICGCWPIVNKITVKLHAEKSGVVSFSCSSASTGKLGNIHIPVSPVDHLSAPVLNRSVTIVEEVVSQGSFVASVVICVASNLFKRDSRATSIHCKQSETSVIK